MDSQRITVRISRNLKAFLRHRSRAEGTTPSQLVRIALENYLRTGIASSSAYELAREAGLIGCIHDAAPDLSSNFHHFKVFGRNK